MKMAIQAYLRDGLPVPEPQTEYSGNINIRVDPELHARLAQEAATYEMSLNKYTSLILERRKTGTCESVPVIRDRKRGRRKRRADKERKR